MDDLCKKLEKMTTDEQYQYMQENGILTDCTFVVGPEDGETREFKAHRVYIARVSPVFASMLLRGVMVEAKTGHVRVTDLSPDTFQLLLNLIYGKKPKLSTFQEAQDLAFAADKYHMKSLLENCVTRMSSLVTHENIWTALDTAEILLEERLKKACVQVLQCDTLRCITNAEFMQTSKENVELLLQQDELNVDDELLLMNVIVHWARRTARRRGLSGDDSGVRAVLEPRLLKLLRFLAMSPQQFTLGPGLSVWLTKDEKSAISGCLKSGDISQLPRHISSVAATRIKVTIAKTSAVVQEIPSKQPMTVSLICKRETNPRISRRSNVRLSGNNTFIENGSLRDYKCAHATLIFKVNTACKWLGFQCVSRYAIDPRLDHSFLSSKNRFYYEDIVANAFTFNHSLSICFPKSKIASNVKYTEQADYNSTFTVMFKKPINLVSDNWFAVEVTFRHRIQENQDSEALILEYQNPWRAEKVVASAVEFTFVTQYRDGYYSSHNDGLIESLMFSM